MPQAFPCLYPTENLPHMKFLQAINRFISRHELLPPRARVLVALSGGADSVALLLALRRLGYDTMAVHCNFLLRGAESDRDEAFVRTLCREWNVPLHVRAFDTTRVARGRGVSLEMAARDLRYAWFGELADEHGIQRIAVAHHRDDNAETFFLNLTRGCGLRGLGGMQPRHGRIIRPLLCVNRMQIEQWLTHEQTAFVTDSTNTDTAIRRNKIRHEVLPLLRSINPSFDNQLAATMQRATAARRFEQQAVAEVFRRALHILPDGVALLTAALADDPAAEPALFTLFRAYGFPTSITEDAFSHTITASESMYETATHLAVCTPYSIEVRRRPLQFGAVPLQEGENLLPDGTCIRLTTCEDTTVDRHRHVACLDADTLQGTLYCRSTTNGDRFTPYGMRGTKLVNDILCENGQSRVDRLAAKVICDRQNIVWVAGVRTSNRHAVTSRTRRVVRLELIS